MDWAPDYTPRAKITYVSAGLTHSMTIRGHRDESMLFTTARADAVTAAVSADLENYLFDDFSITKGEYFNQDSNISIPYTPTPVAAGSNAKSTASVQDKISHLTFQGRTTGGTKAKLFVFGVFFNPDVSTPSDEGDFRITGAEDAVIALFISHLNGLNLVGNDDLTVAWHNYANLKVNDYWLRQARKGAITPG